MDDINRMAAMSEEESAFEESEDLYRLYLEEMAHVRACSPQEERELLEAVLGGDEASRGRLVEAKLQRAVGLSEEYRDRGLSMNDLVQEANMALLLAVREYSGGDFDRQLEERIRGALEEALSLQAQELGIEEEMAARVNVLKDISAAMAEELGREASVAELAERMKMTEDEIKDIMKLTLDAMSVSGE